MSTGTPKLSFANLPTRGQVDQASDLFEPRCEIRTTVRHAASGHILDLAFENVPVDKVLGLLDARGLLPVERGAASSQPAATPGGNTPAASRAPVCVNPNCTHVGKPLVAGNFGLRCNGKDAITGNAKGYCQSKG